MAPEHTHEHEHDHDHGHEHAHGHDHSHDHRAASGRALRIALLVLSVFFVVELVGGLLTNSLALISDAAHLLSDVAAVALALFAQWFARRPPSADRSYGYRRVEILAALLNGLTLILVAVYIAYEAFHRLQQPPAVLGLPMILVASVGLVAQLLVTLVLSRAKGESLNVRGAYLHAMTDAVQSVGVVIAGVVMLLTGWYIVDPIISVVIGLLVAYSGGKIIWEATHVLIEGTPKEIDLARIVAQMERTPGVERVTDLHAWSLTTGYNALSAHVEADTSAGAGEALLRRLTEELHTSFPIQHVTLQIERSCEMCDCCGGGSWLERQPREEGA
jgi:cobalt-zinc-cadmium efflux system protein